MPLVGPAKWQVKRLTWWRSGARVGVVIGGRRSSPSEVAVNVCSKGSPRQIRLSRQNLHAHANETTAMLDWVDPRSIDDKGNTLWGPTIITGALYCFGVALVCKSIVASSVMDTGRVNWPAFVGVYEEATRFSALGINYVLVTVGCLTQARFQFASMNPGGMLGLLLGLLGGYRYLFLHGGHYAATLLCGIMGGLIGSSLKRGKRRRKRDAKDAPEEDLHSS